MGNRNVLLIGSRVGNSNAFGIGSLDGEWAWMIVVLTEFDQFLDFLDYDLNLSHMWAEILAHLTGLELRKKYAVVK